MGINYGPRFDADVYDWSVRVASNGGSVSKSVAGAVLSFTLNLKDNGLWSKLKEIYILSGVTDLTSTLTKLKYISTPQITNSGFSSGNYTATGSQCGVSSDGASVKQLLIGVTYTDLVVNNRSVAVYETRRQTSFYSTVIGRESGGGNSAFGPTTVPGATAQARFLDVGTGATALGSGSASTTAGGLLYAGAATSVVSMYASKTWSSTAATQSGLNGTGSYLIGGAIGGGAVSNSTVSLGFVGEYLTEVETQLLSTYCDALMTSFGGAV